MTLSEIGLWADEPAKVWTLEGLTYTEVARQEYSGNNCIFSAGFVEGEDKPDVDTMYLKLEKDGVEPTILLLRPDEMQIITWLSSGVVWSHLMNHKQPDAATSSAAPTPPTTE